MVPPGDGRIGIDLGNASHQGRIVDENGTMCLAQKVDNHQRPIEALVERARGDGAEAVPTVPRRLRGLERQCALIEFPSA
ncbi:hypothetical protein ACFXPS_38940 [Nocardia sp. NPDC059091]|uniref:hypothetical protein n=1 Tax=unclassified Nocardia TaxID=2637762 RepID=UPI0036AE88E9